MKPYEVAREKVAEKVWMLQHFLLPWATAPEYLKTAYRNKADDLFSLEIPHEGKTIRFGLFEDAELPENWVVREYEGGIEAGMGFDYFDLTEEDKAGWHKVIKKGE